MLVIAAGTLVAIAAVLSVLWWLLVGVPQTMLTSTLGYACVPGLGIDCARAIADSRQAVPLTLGGLLGVVGVVFTYLRWRAERDSTDETIEEGKRAAERLKREGDQLEVTRITDALGLLESDDAAKRTAAISLLIDYAVTTDQHRYTRLILDVLVSFLAREEQHGYDLSGDGVTDERLPLSPPDDKRSSESLTSPSNGEPRSPWQASPSSTSKHRTATGTTSACRTSRSIGATSQVPTSHLIRKMAPTSSHHTMSAYVSRTAR